MAKYATIHHHVTLFGDMFGGTEIWSTGFALGQTNGGDEGDAPTLAEAQAIAEAFEVAWKTTTFGASPDYRFLGAKVSHVNTAGKSDAGNTQFYTLPTPAAGARPGTQVPQVSLVATLTTLKQRGAGSKGRMFLPGINFPIGSDGKIGSGAHGGVANLLKTFLDTVNASTAVPGVAVLMSAEKTGVPFRAAEMNRIAGVRVGNVYDTQRRRRNALTEQYISATLA